MPCSGPGCYIHSMKIKVRIPASTSNLGPGFDTLGMALTLHNEMELYVTGNGGEHVVEMEGVRLEPGRVEGNLAVRAMERTWKALGCSIPGFHLRLTNNIPMGRGLGSSGATVIGGILAASAASGRTLAEHEALALAMEFEGHPDNVTPSLVGGVTVSSVINGEAGYIRIPVPSGLFSIVAVIPETRLATRMARQALPDSLPYADAARNVNRVALLVASLFSGDIRYLREAVEDRLHQPYRAPLIQGFNEVLEAGYLAGAKACFLSGAGSSVIALARENVNLIGENMVAEWKRFGVAAEYRVLGIDCGGAEVLR